MSYPLFFKKTQLFVVHISFCQFFVQTHPISSKLKQIWLNSAQLGSIFKMSVKSSTQYDLDQFVVKLTRLYKCSTYCTTLYIFNALLKCTYFESTTNTMTLSRLFFFSIVLWWGRSPVCFKNKYYQYIVHKHTVTYHCRQDMRTYESINGLLVSSSYF